MIATEKLLKLAAFLETEVEDDWFDLKKWATAGFPEKVCGTVACAMGWATVCFPDQGLTLVPHKGQPHLLRPCFCLGGIEYLDLDAAVRFFGIPYQEACWLFFSSCYPMRGMDQDKQEISRTEVIERIREYVKDEKDKS